MDQLDDVADDSCKMVSLMDMGRICDLSLTHDQETDSYCLRDPDELLLVGLCNFALVWRWDSAIGDNRTGAAVHEESTLLEELSGHTVSHVSHQAPIVRG